MVIEVTGPKREPTIWGSLVLSFSLISLMFVPFEFGCFQQWVEMLFISVSAMLS